jgi:site-specific recombinase XerD
MTTTKTATTATKRKEPAKMRGIYEKVKGSNVWWISYKQGSIHKREKAGSRGAAIDLYRKRKTDLLAGAKLPPNLRTKGITFGKLAEDAIEWYVARKKKDLRNVRGRMKFLVEEFGDQAASKITPAHIDSWMASHKDWSPATGNRYRALMSKVYKLAMVSGKVPGNPARLVEMGPESKGRLRWMEQGGDEEKALFDVVRKDYSHRMSELVISLGTGMRLSEQYSLDWSGVAFKAGKHGVVKLDETKNGSHRDIPMGTAVRAAFEEIQGRTEKTGPDDRVFDTNTPRKWFESALEKAGITDYSWHCNRHSFCSRLIKAGVDLKTAQVLMGHKTLSMTARYSHLGSTHIEDAIANLD